MAEIYLPNREDVQTLGGHIAPILSSTIEACYEALAMKGAEIPEERTLANLSAAIASIDINKCRVLSDTQYGLSIDVEKIGRNALIYDTKLSSIYAPRCKSICQNAFHYCSNLQVADFPECSFIDGTDNAVFSHCTKLSAINFPKLQQVTGRPFYYCTNLDHSLGQEPGVVELPQLENAPEFMFDSCYKIQKLKLPSLRSFTRRGIWSANRILSCLELGHSMPNATIATNAVVLKEVHVKREGEKIIFYKNVFTNIPTTCVFYCSDGTIEYVEGAWTFIPTE